MSKQRLLRKATVSNLRQNNKYISKRCVMFVHTEDFSTNELVINTQAFPSIVVGDVIEIVPYSKGASGAVMTVGSVDEDDMSLLNEESGLIDQPLMIRVNSNSLNQTKGVQYISVLRNIADLFGL